MSYNNGLLCVQSVVLGGGEWAYVGGEQVNSPCNNGSRLLTDGVCLEIESIKRPVLYTPLQVPPPQRKWFSGCHW